MQRNTKMREDCLFCKIVNQQIPTKLIYEDETVIAFNDINPQAPVHALIVPREHIDTINNLENENLAGHMILTAKRLSGVLGIEQSGYRLIMNCNEDGGQTVFHIHLHLLGGKQLGELVQ